jgi:pyruvate dehydrogenase E1 component alpha subunit
MNASELIAFEDDIAECFANKQILAPIHLDNGNEEQIIKIFQEYQISADDWVCGTWRMHYKCLLKGVPPERLKQDILDRKSINLNYPEYNIVSSAIVGGIYPIALGIALGIKIKNSPARVFCWSGDMGSETGSFYESVKYATNFKLPIYFVIEDNDKSVCTPTRETWGNTELLFEQGVTSNIIYYRYESKWPHAGGKSRVNF